MNELQLQRLIDGELNDADQREFLTQLDQKNDTAAWRTLALGFVEDRLFHNALAGEAPSPPTSSIGPHRRDSLLSNQKPFSAWSVLTLCIGVVAGVLLMQSFSHQGFTGIAQTSENENETIPQHSGAETVAPNVPQVVAMDAQKQRAPEMHFPKPAMHLQWKTNEDQSVSLPVYSPEQYAEASRLQQLRPFPKQWQKELESRGYKVQRKPRIYRFPMDDGREILVPTESVQVRYAVY